MRVEFEVIGGQCLTPCPRGLEPKVHSFNCECCPHYGQYLGEMAIECKNDGLVVKDGKGILYWIQRSMDEKPVKFHLAKEKIINTFNFQKEWKLT